MLKVVDWKHTSLTHTVINWTEPHTNFCTRKTTQGFYLFQFVSLSLGFGLIAICVYSASLVPGVHSLQHLLFRFMTQTVKATSSKDFSQIVDRLIQQKKCFMYSIFWGQDLYGIRYALGEIYNFWMKETFSKHCNWSKAFGWPSQQLHLINESVALGRRSKQTLEDLANWMVQTLKRLQDLLRSHWLSCVCVCV